MAEKIESQKKLLQITIIIDPEDIVQCCLALSQPRAQILTIDGEKEIDKSVIDLIDYYTPELLIFREVSKETLNLFAKCNFVNVRRFIKKCYDYENTTKIDNMVYTEFGAMNFYSNFGISNGLVCYITELILSALHPSYKSQFNENECSTTIGNNFLLGLSALYNKGTSLYNHMARSYVSLFASVRGFDLIHDVINKGKNYQEFCDYYALKFIGHGLDIKCRGENALLILNPEFHEKILENIMVNIRVAPDNIPYKYLVYVFTKDKSVKVDIVDLTGVQTKDKTEIKEDVKKNIYVLIDEWQKELREVIVKLFGAQFDTKNNDNDKSCEIEFCEKELPKFDMQKFNARKIDTDFSVDENVIDKFNDSLDKTLSDDVEDKSVTSDQDGVDKSENLFVTADESEKLDDCDTDKVMDLENVAADESEKLDDDTDKVTRSENVATSESENLDDRDTDKTKDSENVTTSESENLDDRDTDKNKDSENVTTSESENLDDRDTDKTKDSENVAVNESEKLDDDDTDKVTRSENVATSESENLDDRDTDKTKDSENVATSESENLDDRDTDKTKDSENVAVNESEKLDDDDTDKVTRSENVAADESENLDDGDTDKTKDSENVAADESEKMVNDDTDKFIRSENISVNEIEKFLSVVMMRSFHGSDSKPENFPNNSSDELE